MCYDNNQQSDCFNCNNKFLILVFMARKFSSFVKTNNYLYFSFQIKPVMEKTQLNKHNILYK